MQKNTDTSIHGALEPSRMFSMQKIYHTDSPSEPLITINEMVAFRAKEKGTTEIEAAQKLLGGDLLQKWLKDNDEKIDKTLPSPL